MNLTRWLTWQRATQVGLACLFAWMMDHHQVENAVRVLFVFVLVVGYKEL